MHRLDRYLYPQLGSFPPDEREAALRKARAAPFDVFELVGMAAGLVVTTAATRYSVAGLDALARIATAVIAAIIGAALVTALVGPFMIRRTRRSLADQLHEPR